MAKLKESYVNALLERSEESGTLERDLEQASLVRDELKGEDVQKFLVHPNVSNTVKHKLFQDAFSDKISIHLMEFLDLMIRKNQESLILLVLTEYIERANKRLKKIEAKVVSAKALTEEQIISIRTILSKQIDMQVEITTKVDSDVIGGFYILVDGHIFDGTVRSDLNIMRERLRKGSYE